MKLKFLCGICVTLLLLAVTVSQAAEFRVPLFTKPPVIDGKISPAEWANAAELDGFVAGNVLERRHIRGWVGADATNIYVAIQSQLPDKGQLAAVVMTDSVKIAFDDAAEIYIDPTPDAADRVDYQFLANSIGKGAYNIHKLGSPNESEAWRGNWKTANSVADGWWNFECAIPIASMNMTGKGRKTTDGVWGINLTRDWKPDWGWSSFTGAYNTDKLHFTFTKDPAPGVQYFCEGDPTFPPAVPTLRLSNPGSKPLAVKALLDVVRNNMPELKTEQTLTLAPGASQPVTVPLSNSDPTTHYDLTARVTSPDGSVVYYDRQTSWTRAKEAEHWMTGTAAAVAPLDFQFAYYPTKNVMRINADIANLPKDAKLTKLTATIIDRLSGQNIKAVDFPLNGFTAGKQELRFELPPLDGYYKIALQGEGTKVPTASVVKEFERKRFPWEELPDGRNTTVYPPFTPIAVNGNTLNTVLRTHTLNNLGLLDQVVATSANTGVAKPILAAPMRYTATVEGKDVPVSAEPLKVTTAQPDKAIVEGGFSAGALQANYKDTWDYDGTMRVDLTLQPTNGKTVNALTLDIPFSNDSAALIHANSDRIRASVAEKVPQGTGVVWDATKLACDDYIRNFCPYIYLGTAVRGLCWFAENDKNWGWDPQTSNVQVIRDHGQVILRVHLINAPTVIAQARTLTFGLLAAPIKPRWSNDGQNWQGMARAGYNLMGTDINWLAASDCGSVYPAGQDMYLWEQIKRGNTTHVSDEDIATVVKHDVKYFEPFGAEMVNTFKLHAQVNMRSRYNAKMVFYYNRATSAIFDEFQTFRDEWTLDDYRTGGAKTDRSEIKVVPSASYEDYNLYWYARAFEVGGNTGIYWDNWFYAPSNNTEMTDAYRKSDGTIVPATGVWEMRELAKRTFIMMNERKMIPFIWPHITSFSSLPMLSFATAQLDWEWKYSEGDVQNRHTREYIQLATDGELAGTWPFALHDQGALANDPWTQRTFDAVLTVHDLVHDQVWLNRPELQAMYNTPGVQVYRYWEEQDRPTPVRACDPTANTTDNDLPSIVYSVPGKEAIAVIVSYARTDETAMISVNQKTLGFTNGCTVVNAETNQPVTMTDGKIILPIKKHDELILRFTAK